MESGGAVEIKLGGCFLRGFPLLCFAFGIVWISVVVFCVEREGGGGGRDPHGGK